MRILIRLGLIVVTASLLAGAADDPRTKFTAKLSGAKVRPQVVTDTKGRFSITFNEEDTKARFNLRVVDGTEITQAHLHCHDADINDSIAASLFGLIPGGFDVNGRLASFTLDDKNIAVLDSDCGITSLSELHTAVEQGRIYVNVHSVANPSGEVRGQVSYKGKDTDGDGIRDTRDADIDGDGIVNEEDPEPFHAAFNSGPPRIVTFHFSPSDGGGSLSCNEVPAQGEIPIKCQFDNDDQLTISRENWSGGIAVLHEDNTITGNCDGSLIRTPNVVDDYNLNPACVVAPIPPPPPRQDASGERLLDEWFTDLPWHQKLSTKDSNLIDVPFVMPFEALPDTVCQLANTDIDKSRCMLRYGIVSVMGMHRTDTLYKPEEAPPNQDCQDGQCVEVKLEIQRFNTLTDNFLGYQADEVRNNAYSYPDPNPPPNTPPDKIGKIRVPSQGFAITEATIFAPWLPWCYVPR